MANYFWSTARGGLAKDCLYLISLNSKNEDEGEWTKIKIIGYTLGERYGHSLTYLKPYFFFLVVILIQIYQMIFGL